MGSGFKVEAVLCASLRTWRHREVGQGWENPTSGGLELRENEAHHVMRGEGDGLFLKKELL